MMERIVLMYHDIGSESGFQNSTAMKYKVSPETFDIHVKNIDRWCGDNNFDKEKVIITFDDGGISFLTIAVPILEKYGFKGIFFIATKYIGTKGFLTEGQVKELFSRGHIVGSHSFSHPERITALSKTEIELEWSASQKRLNEILGFSPVVASIPNGYSSPAVIEAMVNAGIDTIYTSKPSTKVKKSNNYTIYGRYAITADCSSEDVIRLISSSKKRFMISSRSKILYIAKLLLGPLYLVIRSKIMK